MTDGQHTPGPAPGFAKHPGYRVTVDGVPARIRAVIAGEAVADSARALLMRETGHRGVFYFPRADVRMDLLEKTDHDTY